MMRRRSLGARLARISERSPARAGCETCGHRLPPTLPAEGPVRVIWAEDEPDTPETCPTCGRHLVFRLRFDNAG